ncbi:MAG: hypothetical protein WCS03_16740, partial [Bacteroidota bacterium]
METTFSKGNNTGNSYIAFFDLDRTITKAISGKALARSAFKNGLMTRFDLVVAISELLTSFPKNKYFLAYC